MLRRNSLRSDIGLSIECHVKGRLKFGIGHDVAPRIRYGVEGNAHRQRRAIEIGDDVQQAIIAAASGNGHRKFVEERRRCVSGRIGQRSVDANTGDVDMMRFTRDCNILEKAVDELCASLSRTDAFQPFLERTLLVPKRTLAMCDGKFVCQ